jgi:hypothetical protein
MKLLRVIFALPTPSLLGYAKAFRRAQFRLAIACLTVFLVDDGWSRFIWLGLAMWEGSDWWRERGRMKAWDRRSAKNGTGVPVRDEGSE